MERYILIHVKEEELGTREEEEAKVLTEHHQFVRNISKQSAKIESGSVMSIEKLRKATMNNVLVIDKYLTLFYPLNDPRTSPLRRKFYLEQEQLMIDLSKIETEEEEEAEVYSCEGAAPTTQSTFPVPTESDLAIAKAQNQRFLEWLEKHSASSF
jgi:hypothetical protein